MRSTILMPIILLLSNTMLANTIQVNVLTLTTLPLSVNAEPKRLDKNTFTNVKISMLDFPALILEKINQRMKGKIFSNSKALQHDLNFWLNRQTRVLPNAYAGIELAVSLQIHQLPAVVFSHKYVVYGTTDVSAAYKAYKVWQQRHGVFT